MQKLFDVSDGRVSRALKTIKDKRSPGENRRGKSAGSSRKLPQDFTDHVIINHIQRFPAYQSHYTRSHNIDRKYLRPDLNVHKMLDLYVEECQKNNVPSIKLSYYRTIFNTRFNLHFHAPRKDTCKRCDAFNIRLEATAYEETKQQIKRDRELHQRKTDAARQRMNSDAEKAKIDPSLYVCSMDLQKALPFPVLTVSEA